MFRYILLIGLIFSFHAQALTIVHNRADEPKEKLVLDILKLALSKSMPGTEFEALPEFVDAARAVEYVKSGALSVVWSGTSKKLEQELLPVRIPILKGMLGYRVFIIRRGDQHLFDKVNNLDDLKKIRFGQGRFWGDTAVLKSAGFNVVTPVKYKNLFPMLDGGRYDAFPRAIHEPWSEVASRRELNLEIEKRILLVYPFAMYFFVSKDSPRLAKLINDGFEKAIADGSFNKYFFDNPVIKSTLEQADLKNRVVIKIPNPEMSAETPLNRPEFWLDITKL